MELNQVFIKVGTVKQVLPEGNIKARVEGTFDDEDLSKLPPIRYSPFTGSNSYETPSVGQRVWVIGDHSDPLTLFWLPINETSFPQNQYTSTEEHKEMLLNEGCSILIKKPMAGGAYEATYYIDNNGCHISDGGTEIIVSNTGGVTVKADKITLGDENNIINIGSAQHRLAYSNIVDRKITDLSAAITKLSKKIEMAAKSSPYTVAIGAALATMEPTLQQLKSDTESTGSGVQA